MAYVNIVLADRNWILERLAKELSDRLDYVRISAEADPDAAVQYYVNYSAWQRRVSPIELAWFTHVEPDPAARDRFMTVAHAVDHCVCHARMYEDALRDEGIEAVSTIPPGVDLTALRPVVKIGVVGRTYPSGRKGEHLVAQVMDIPDIEWHFTGHGWPQPGRDLAPDEMAAFYNEMDYILVPSLYEGGPMCVAEAIACGTPVIAPPVGWVQDFPHIAFETGSEEDLRRVLGELVAERFALRAAAEDYGWDRWAERHDTLFRTLLSGHALEPEAEPSEDIGAVGLVLHGSELVVGGGPTVRVPATVAALRRQGVAASVLHSSIDQPLDIDSLEDAAIVQVFNGWPADSALALARQIKGAGKPFVFSPIYLDHSAMPLWGRIVPEIVHRLENPDHITAALADARFRFAAEQRAGRLPGEALPGHDAAVREIVRLADHVVFLSEQERALVEAIGGRSKASSIIRNAIDVSPFADATPDAFAARFGLRDYVLCTARIEPRKNQLMLVHALRDVNVPLVFVGQGADVAYVKLIEGLERENTHLIGRLEPGDPLLASAYAGARVFVLPSWSEGAPLAALEAAATGCRLVLSDRSAEREYFGDLVRYCDPGDPLSIRNAVLETYEVAPSRTERETLQAHVRDEYSYDLHARRLREVYRTTVETGAIKEVAAPRPPASVPPRVIVDVTYGMRAATPTGPARIERLLAEALREGHPDVRFIAFHGPERRFLTVDPRMIGSPIAGAYIKHLAAQPREEMAVEPGTRLIVIGDACARREAHARAVLALVRNKHLHLALWMQDMTIALAPHLRGEVGSSFERNLLLLAGIAGSLLASSKAVADELRRFTARAGLVTVQTEVVSPGSDLLLPAIKPANDDDDDPVEPVRGTFLLAVGTLTERKNPRLLYETMRRLARTLGRDCPTLVIVGPLTNVEAGVHSLLTNDRLVADHVLLLEKTDDATLDWLYRHAAMILHPAIADGAASVPIEALTRHRVVLLSDTVPMDSPADTLVDRLDPAAAAAWAARVRYYLESTWARAAREDHIARTFQSTTWDAAADALLATVSVATAPPELWNTYVPGTLMRLDDRPGLVLRRDGWHPAESWGSWSSAASGRFSLRLPRPVDRDFVFIAQVQALLKTGQTCTCTIRVNDIAVGQMRLHAKGLSLITVELPGSQFSGVRDLEIELVSGRVSRIDSIVPGSTDRRRIGVGLGMFGMFEADYVPLASAFDPATFAAQGAIALGERIDLLRDRRRAAAVMSGATTDIAWGLYKPDGNPQLALTVLDSLSQDLDVRLRFRAVATVERPFSAVIVLPDGTPVGEITATDDDLQETVFVIPAAKRTHPIRLQILAAKNLAANRLGIGRNDTPFGIGILGLDVSCGEHDGSGPVPSAYALGNLMSFRGFETGPGVVTASLYVEPSDWYDAELAGSWTKCESARVSMRIVDPVDRPLTLRMSFSTPVIAGVLHVSGIAIEGGEVAEVRPETGGVMTIDLPVSPESIGDDGVLRLNVLTERTMVPSQWGAEDDRRLGVFVETIRILASDILAEEDAAALAAALAAAEHMVSLPIVEPDDGEVETDDEIEIESDSKIETIDPAVQHDEAVPSDAEDEDGAQAREDDDPDTIDDKESDTEEEESSEVAEDASEVAEDVTKPSGVAVAANDLSRADIEFDDEDGAVSPEGLAVETSADDDDDPADSNQSTDPSDADPTSPEKPA